MNTGDLRQTVRWDTFSNRIYFDVDKNSLKGKLILSKTADGKIDMHIAKQSITAGKVTATPAI